MMKKKIAVMATVLAVCGSLLAAADYTIMEKADKVETTVYGSVQSGAMNDRVDNLDVLINGKKTVTGTVENRTDSLYNDVYGSNGSDLSMLAAVNMMQWRYFGVVSHEPIVERVSALEQSLNGKVSTGSLAGRVSTLRSNLLGHEKYVSMDVTIPAGTIVKLKNVDELNSKTNKKGDTVRLNVIEDVMVGEVVAIPRGSECEATITGLRKAGRFGRDGKITLTYDNVWAANSTPVPLTVGEKTKEEYKRTAGAVGASAAGAIILGPVGLVGGLFVNGNDAKIPAGSTLLAETKTDTEVIGFHQTTATADTNNGADAAAASAVTATTATTTTAATADTTAATATTTPTATAIGAQTSTSAEPVTVVQADIAPIDAVTVVKTQDKATGVDLSKQAQAGDPSAVVTISSNK